MRIKNKNIVPEKDGKAKVILGHPHSTYTQKSPKLDLLPLARNALTPFPQAFLSSLSPLNKFLFRVKFLSLTNSRLLSSLLVSDSEIKFH